MVYLIQYKGIRNTRNYQRFLRRIKKLQRLNKVIVLRGALILKDKSLLQSLLWDIVKTYGSFRIILGLDEWFEEAKQNG